MPRITIQTGLPGSNGREQSLSEYFCDWPACPNVATQVLGRVLELRQALLMCDEHAAAMAARNRTSESR